MTDPAYPDALPAQTRLHWYVIERVLGQGGFGITYLARDSNLDQRVAIKEFLPVEFATRTADATIRPRTEDLRDRYRWGLERFLQEARTLARFEHANIVRVLSVFEFNNTAYMVMRFEEGANLGAVLDRRGTLPENELLAIVLPILDGLELIHGAGFIHRDIKPDNIYLRGNGQPVLLDFGSARQATGTSHTLTILVAPGYAPFEQYYSDSGNQGPWTDIYALAATCYRAIAGRPPLDAIARSKGMLGSTQESMVSAGIVGAGRYSARLLAAIDHALAFTEKDRPQTIAQWRTELAEELAVTRSRTAQVPPAISQPPKGHALEPTSLPAVAPHAIASVPPATARRLPLGASTMIAGGALTVLAIAAAYFFAFGRPSSTAAETELATLREQLRKERDRSSPRQQMSLTAQADSPVTPERTGTDKERSGTAEAPLPELRVVPEAKKPDPPPAPAPAIAATARVPKDKVVAPVKKTDAKPPATPSPPAKTPIVPEQKVALASAPPGGVPELAAKPTPTPAQESTSPPASPTTVAAPPTPAMQLAEVQRAYRAGQYADALKLARPLADEGNAGAQLVLGEAYADGRGVVRDVREAEKWLELSSERGNIDATTRLGSLFAAMGNRNGAYMWYGCAAKLGSGSARAEQARLASSLQPSELTQAEQAIKSCVSKRTRS